MHEQRGVLTVLGVTQTIDIQVWTSQFLHLSIDAHQMGPVCLVGSLQLVYSLQPDLL